MNLMPDRKLETNDDYEPTQQPEPEPLQIVAFVDKVDNTTRIYSKQPVKVVVFEHDKNICDYMDEEFETDEPESVTVFHADKAWYMDIFHGTKVPESDKTLNRLIEKGKKLKKEAIAHRIEQLNRQNDEVMAGIREMAEVARSLDD